MPSRKIKIKIKGAEGGRRTAGRKLDESSSAVGSIKNTTEEVTETDDGRKCNGGRGSWRKGNGRGLECPLTEMANKKREFKRVVSAYLFS